jgi:putative FmdB family regulatory protein
MPTYDFECPVHGVFEAFRTLDTFSDKIECTVDPDCGQTAEQVILPRRMRLGNAYLPEITYFEDASGHVILAGSSNDTAPNGYVKKATGLLNEQRKLSSRLDSQDRRLFNEMMAGEQAYLSQEISEQHREMRGMMENYSEIAKDYARMAMEKNNKESSIWDRSGDKLNFGFLKVLEMDDRR